MEWHPQLLQFEMCDNLLFIFFFFNALTCLVVQYNLFPFIQMYHCVIVQKDIMCLIRY